jgi:hypothetical protein
MTTRAVDGGAARGSEKVDWTGVLPTWVVVTIVEILRMGLRLSMPKFNTPASSSKHSADRDFHGI